MTTTVAQHTPAPQSTTERAPTANPAIERQNLLGMSREQMEAFFLSIGEKKFRAAQVMKWIHQEGSDDFAAMTNLSKPLREKLAKVAEIRGPSVVYEGTSSDGTRKWVLEVEDGSYVETVLIPAENGKRRTL
ncbi:MAG: 23S rRNA (adenine(2503)-C(2))-methyltransferase RlmN, partial [Halomonas sp.]|nr:23S rRNA (adenine(2503)-C(2))-methyltransferase RlmN [Halomonas sp.]